MPKRDTVAAIVLSYNRPRMLKEALKTVRAADQVIVTDDGSDFDVPKLLRRMDLPPCDLVTLPPMTVEERLVTPRLGKLINTALARVTADVAVYLCDDDLFAPEWIPAVSAYFGRHPEQHFVRGEWWKFEDGQSLDQAVVHVHPDWRQMTCGNFAHRIQCFREEGVRWDESRIAVHDDAFLWRMDRVHSLRQIPDLGVLAGYRRIHRHNMLLYTGRQGEYAPTARAILAEGFLEG